MTWMENTSSAMPYCCFVSGFVLLLLTQFSKDLRISQLAAVSFTFSFSSTHASVFISIFYNQKPLWHEPKLKIPLLVDHFLCSSLWFW